MPIISVKDNKNNRWRGNAKTKKQNKKSQKEDGSYSERVRDKWFCSAFNLGFLQLILKASLFLSRI